MMRIARHEWRLMAAAPSVWITTLLFTGLIGYAVWNGAAWVGFQRAAIAAASADADRRFQALVAGMDTLPADAEPPEQFAVDPRSPASVGATTGAPYAVLPPGPLAALAVGQSDLHASYVKITTRSRQSFENPDEIDNPANLLAGRFDLAFALVYLVPLLVLVLSYDLLSGERERGTLGLLLSQPIPVRRLVLAKVAARGALILGVVVAGALAGLAITGTGAGASEVAGRLSLWVAVVTGYTLFWLGLAVAVNLAGWGSATNALTLAAAWLALVVVGPAILNVVVKSAYPVPSRVELIGAMREASNAATTQGSALLGKFYQDHPDLTPRRDSLDLEDFMSRTYSVQDAVDRELAPVVERYESQLASQQAAVERFRALSPAIVTQEALNDLAGTGLARYRRFRDQVAAFHREWQRFFLPRIFQRRLLARADYDAMPRFVYQDEPSRDVSRRVLEALFGLLVPSALVWSAAALGLRRFTAAG
jgi:ABC-2 type transport system permease protein